MFEIDQEMEENAPKLFKKTKEILLAEVAELRSWMKSQSEIFPEVMNDNMLRNFIVINKFRTEKAKDHIENYYKVRVQYPDFYKKCNPKLENIKVQWDMFYWVSLPQLTNEMDRITICKMANVELLQKYELMNHLKLILAVFELRMQVDYMVNNIFVIDYKDVPLHILIRATPNACYKMLRILERVYSFRISKVYFINVPSYGLFIYSMLKTIMKKKLYERVQVCANDSILHETFSKTMLPRDYGGEEKSLEELNKMQKGYFAKNQARFDRLDEIQAELMSLNEKNGHNCVLS